MPNPINLSVIVPCYDEEKNISLIAERFNAIRPANFAVELVLVDNGSTDRTNEEIKKVTARHPFIKPAFVEKNIGYGFGILTGLRQAAGEFLCWTHADMQTDLGDAIKAYNLIIGQENPKTTFVKGSRKGRPLFDNFFTVGMALFETLLLGQWLWEINAQPKLFYRSLLDLAENPPNDWSLDLYFYYLAKKNKFAVKTIDVIFPERIHGQSHWNTGGIQSKMEFIKRTLDYSFQLRRKLK